MADRKTWAELVIMPLVLAIVGTASTFFITRFQARHTDEMARAERDAAQVAADAQVRSAEWLARREQTLKVLEIFGVNILKNEPAARRLAVGMLPAIDSELGAVLAAEIAKSDTDPTVRDAASKVESAAIGGEIRELVASFSGTQRRSASTRLVSLYARGSLSVRRSIVDDLVAAVMPEGDPQSYRVNLYVALTLSLIRPAWSGTQEQKAVIESQRQTNNYADPTFRIRVDQALSNYSAAR
jgi:hypothetical protein